VSKKPLFLLALLLLSYSVFADSAFAGTPGQRDWWYTLQRGKLLFSQGDYGRALLTFEDARRNRRTVFDRMERDLVELLSMREVRRLGDSLEWVERFIRERHFTAAATALEELYFRIPREQFGDSVTAALEGLGSLRYFPEAEMWIGKTFLAGGEFALATRQFELALSQRHLFENPAVAMDLMYEIANIRRIRQEYPEMERVLYSILMDSTLWAGTGQGGNVNDFARQAMRRTLENSGVDRFLSLYRYGNTQTLRAHRELGFYQAALGRTGPAQEHLMFAFMIQNTVIIDEIIRRRFDFGFTTLEALAHEINRDPFLLAYAEEIGYFRTAFYLANTLFGNGNAARARELWGFLATQHNAGEWQARAASQLRSPRRLGPTIVMP